MTEQRSFALAAPVVALAWRESHKGSPALLALADRHYTRQQPGEPQFCRPGVNLCLVLSDGAAGWVVWHPIPEVGRMDGLEAWECTFFRNESRALSSTLIADATTRTFRAWGWPPKDGLITAVGIAETRRRRSRRAAPGACFIHAGWSAIGDRNGRAWLRAPHPGRTERAA